MVLKTELLKYLSKLIAEQTQEVKEEIESIRSEMGNETKSSAGDKFETSREMMSQEKNRLEDRLSILMLQQMKLNEMMDLPISDLIDYGSLVQTNDQLFLFGLSLGKISFQSHTIMAVSLNSPVGKVFQGKKTNESISFMNKNYIIQTLS